MITAVVRFRLPQGTTRDDAKAMVDQISDGKIDMFERATTAWMKIARGDISTRFDKIRDTYIAVAKDTKTNIEREQTILEAYMDFRGALKQAEVSALEVLKIAEGRLDKAKAELAKAKAKVDRPLTVGYLNGFSQTEQAATVMANGLRKIGIESKLVGELWPTMVDRMKKPETSPDLVVYWISTYYADPHNWIGEMFHSGQWGTFKSSSFYKNPKVDELLDTALKSTDRKVREKAYQDAARIVVEEAAGVWIYNTKYFGPWAKNLEGIRFSPIGNGQEIRWLYYK